MIKTCTQCSIVVTQRNTSKGKRICKQCEQENGKVYRTRIKYHVLRHYGKDNQAQCTCCGETRIEFLTLDHTNNNGGEERKALRAKGSAAGAGGWKFYHYIRTCGYPDGYTTLCFNCNSARGAYGYCPHDTESDKRAYIDSLLQRFENEEHVQKEKEIV